METPDGSFLAAVEVGCMEGGCGVLRDVCLCFGHDLVPAVNNVTSKYSLHCKEGKGEGINSGRWPFGSMFLKVLNFSARV